MGAKSWDRLHNAIYVISPLAVVHYLLSPDIYPEQYLMTGIIFWLMLWRILNRRRLGTNAAALAALAVASSVFTAVVQTGWIWAYQGYNFSEVFDVYFTLALGIPAPVKILVLGLVIACAAAARQAFGGKPARVGVDKAG
jgi:sulfoxide reductase heme-binding subunit YedZ